MYFYERAEGTRYSCGWPCYIPHLLHCPAAMPTLSDSLPQPICISLKACPQFEYDPGTGYELVLNDEVYTCGGPFLKANTDCLKSQEDRNRIEGKQVSATCFYQAMYPFIESRRIVDIAYDGTSLLPGDYLGKQLQKERERSKRLMLLGFVVFFLGGLYAEWVTRKEKEN